MGAASHTLGRRAAFRVAAAAVAHTLWTSAAPAVSYPLYAVRWHLSPTVTTGMFAVYPVMVVLTLLLFGNLSDQVGRRAMILAGVGASLLGVLLFTVASGVGWVYAGRVLMGIGVGLSAGPSTAALVEFSAPGQQARANSIATAATALGMGLATLLGGALIQYAPWPLHLNFIVLAGVLVALLAVAWFLPRPTLAERATAPRWRPGTVIVPRGLVRVFVTSATAVTAGFAMGALMLSLGAQIAHELIGSANALVNGAVLALFALTTGATALVARRMAGAPAVVSGGLVAATALALLMLAAREHALALFLVASALSGAGYSLLFLGGLTMINARAPAHHRAGTLSAIYLVGYLMMGAIALTLGVVATHAGLGVALAFGAPAIAAMALAAAALAALGERAQASATRRTVAPRRQVGAET
jgi:MFS family permease